MGLPEGTSKYNWPALHAKFLKSNLSRNAFFLEEGINPSVWKIHAPPSWAHDRLKFQEQVAAKTEEKSIGKISNSLAQYAHMTQTLATMAFDKFFVDEVDEHGEKTGNQILDPTLPKGLYKELMALGLHGVMNMERFKRQAMIDAGPLVQNNIQMNQATVDNRPQVILQIPSNGKEKKASP